MRKSVAKEIEDDAKQKLLDAVYHSLHEGARGSGANLTPAECAALLTQLPSPAERRSPDWIRIDLFCFLMGRDGVEAAVAKAMKHFGVSRAQVYAARKRARDYSRHFGDGSGYTRVQLS